MDPSENSPSRKELERKLVNDMEAMRDASINLSLALQNLIFETDVPRRSIAAQTTAQLITRAQDRSHHKS